MSYLTLNKGFYKIKIILFFIFSILSFITVKGESNGYKNPTPGEFPIVASTPIPHGQKPTYAAFKELIDCGFNLGMERGTIESYKQIFKVIGNLNFKYFISNPELLTNKKYDYINTFKNSKYVVGFNIKDEPTYAQLNSLAQNYKEFRKLCPDKLSYINLLGGIYEPYTGNIKTYPEYLQYIQKLIAPQVWSYDFYPVSRKRGATIIDKDNFYYDLECFWANTKVTGTPFWAYCQSMEFKASYVERPKATEAYLKFEAFSALAYGAQGIIYWTYGQRESNESEKYLSALVNTNGKKTNAWYYAKSVNKEIRKFTQVFLGCEVKEVAHTGEKIYKGTRKFSGNFGPIKSLRSEKEGVMVSLIENNSERYVVIVNHDVENKQTLKIELINNISMINITSSSQVKYTWREDVNVNIDKGGWIILKEEK